MLGWFESVGGPTVLVLIGAILSAIGAAFWSSQRQARQSDGIAKLNKNIAGQQEQLTAKSNA